MSSESGHEGVELNSSVGVEPIVLPSADWENIALLIAALSGLWIASGIAGWSSEASTPTVELWTGGVVVASLVALGLATSKLVSSAQSRTRHVFCGRRVLAFGVFMLVVAAGLTVSIVRRNPFHQLTSRGRITAGEIADAGFVVAVIVCLVGAGVALVDAWGACRDERRWPESLGIPPR